jgi:hypothetical protein
MDPSPGCGSSATVYYVRLPADYAQPTLSVFHGGDPHLKVQKECESD